MESTKKAKRYARLYQQIAGLLKKCELPRARMATITAVLHHKMEPFFGPVFTCLPMVN